MSKSIILITSMEIRSGKLAAFKETIENSLAFAERTGPQLMIQVFIDEKAMQAQSIQYHRDSESIISHWQLADPYIQEVMQYIEMKRVDIYGDPGQAVLDGVAPIWDMGASVRVVPHFAGFSRFPEED